MHSAWTEEPSDGEPGFPRKGNLSHSLSVVLLRHAELVRYCRDRASDDLVELRNRVGFAASRTRRVIGSKTYYALPPRDSYRRWSRWAVVFLTVVNATCRLTYLMS